MLVFLDRREVLRLLNVSVSVVTYCFISVFDSFLFLEEVVLLDIYVWGRYFICLVEYFLRHSLHRYYRTWLATCVRVALGIQHVRVKLNMKTFYFSLLFDFRQFIILGLNSFRNWPFNSFHDFRGQLFLEESELLFFGRNFFENAPLHRHNTFPLELRILNRLHYVVEVKYFSLFFYFRLQFFPQRLDVPNLPVEFLHNQIFVSYLPCFFVVLSYNI